MTKMKWKTCSIGIASLVLAAAYVALPSHRQHAAAEEPQSKVFINGTLYRVHFNDGDSFRIVSGSKDGVRVRLAGYNTLESHGPVHSWGSWDVRELYHLAKMATLHARRGLWKCDTDWKTDGYGRPLLRCLGLAEELIRLGYAHVLSIDDSPGDPTLVAAQKDAIAARRGIWAHGVPSFIVTSVHSLEEGGGSHGKAYNRIVSTEDGHSGGWSHTERYKECENVCFMVYPVDDEKVTAATTALRGDARASELIAGVADDALRGMVRDYAAYHLINRAIPPDRRDALLALLDGYSREGRLGNPTPSPGSCMVYVDFRRRYGNSRASCLKK